MGRILRYLDYDNGLVEKEYEFHERLKKMFLHISEKDSADFERGLFSKRLR